MGNLVIFVVGLLNSQQVKVTETFTDIFNYYVFHQYFLLPISLLDALQLAAGATGLFSQGVTAVIHRCSVRALGPRVNLTHSWRGGNRCHLWLSR